MRACLNTAAPNSPRALGGAALVIVLVLVLAMAVIAGAFAYAMKVEARLAVNTQSTPELEWLGRSGVEYAKWVLDQQRKIPAQAGFDSLKQFWAGGPGSPESVDDPFAGMSLKDIPIGEGFVSIEIIDQERRLNLNTTSEPVLVFSSGVQSKLLYPRAAAVNVPR